jgi:ribosomal protein L11 methyltransferase
MDELKKNIVQFVSESSEKISFGVLRKHLIANFHISTKEAKHLVSKLIQSGDLCYTNQYGNNYLELSFDQPVAVSKNVIVKPTSVTYRPYPGQTVVELYKGLSFGLGDHPSTRLAIRLMDVIFSTYHWRVDKKKLSALDIGTGSGILGILAAKFGIGSVCGIDTDPVAVFEANKNVVHNKVENTVTILAGELDVSKKSYSLGLANLRFPTLMALRNPLDKIITESGLLVLSGLKEEEVEKTKREYQKSGFFLLDQLSELGWASLSMFRGNLIGLKK